MNSPASPPRTPRRSLPPSRTPSDLPKVSDASTMRASISTWRTGMSSLEIISLDLLQAA
jgi:hypothetical protein